VTRANSAGSISVTGANTVTIALFTHTSIGPSSRSTRSAAACTAFASLMSSAMGNARAPSRRMPSATVSSASASRAMSATFAPRCAKCSAAARPTPALAPVTTTIFGVRERNGMALSPLCM
jgi:hypothetical protein